MSDVELGEITPEQFDGEDQELTKAESSPAKATEETKTPDVAEKPEGEETAPTSDEEKTSEEAPETETEDQPEVDETETKAPKAEERKAQLNSEIRDLVAKRNELRKEVETANAATYKADTEDELIEQGMSATDAKVEALRQEIALSRYNEQVVEAQLTLSSEANRVLTDFKWANPDAPEYNEELAQEASALLEDNLILDENTGQIIGSNVSPYKFYQTLDRAISSSKTQGEMQGKQSAEKMLANADTSSNASAATKTDKKSDLDELWEEDLY